MNKTLLGLVLVFVLLLGLSSLFFGIKSAFDGDWSPLLVTIPGWAALLWSVVYLVINR